MQPPQKINKPQKFIKYAEMYVLYKKRATIDNKA